MQRFDPARRLQTPLVRGLSGSAGFSGLFGYSLVQPNTRDGPNTH